MRPLCSQNIRVPYETALLPNIRVLYETALLPNIRVLCQTAQFLNIKVIFILRFLIQEAFCAFGRSDMTVKVNTET